MSTLVETLKRLYQAEKIDIAKLDQIKTSGKISEDEYQHIAEVEAQT